MLFIDWSFTCQPNSKMFPFSQAEMFPFGHQVAGGEEGVTRRFQGWSGADL